MADVYGLHAYGEMIFDRVRTAAYERALAEVVTPSSVVVDIGAGAGVLALLACRLGAARVFAIEPGNIIALAEQMARDNGFGERITFIPRRSQDVELDRKADVIVSDLHGTLPLFRHHIPTIIDARQRLLADGGTLIPQQETLRVALVEDAAIYEQRVGRWSSRPHGLAMEAATPYATQTIFKHRVEPAQLLTEPRPWATLDYRTIATPHVAGEVSQRVCRPGVAHGLALWFEAQLAEGASFACGPGEPPTVYGMAFAPLSHPVAVSPGDEIAVDLRANLGGDTYVWRWETRITEPSGHEKASFRQSSFHGAPLSIAWLEHANQGSR